MKAVVSIIIRTLNEEVNLEELLGSINNQSILNYQIEIIVVDSGSTDNTIEIASTYGAKIIHIKKEDFTFGRSLNLGCKSASGDYFIFVSGHCIPTDINWIENLLSPIRHRICGYTYGKQIGRDTTKFSENQVFRKYYPKNSMIPQEGFSCNNANAAIDKDIWQKYKFDEELTGCEDMSLAKSYVNDGGKLGYVANATVFHIHNESWKSVRRRYERESVALQKIMPEVQITLYDLVYFILIGVLKDLKAAFRRKVFLSEFYGIICYRFNQFMGSYHGNHITREASNKMKQEYFYPREKR